MKTKNLIVIFLLTFSLSFYSQTVFCHSNEIILAKNQVEKFYRTELYFGMNKPDGSEVSEDEWNKFLEAEVTPRFPEGFTVLAGLGQFKDSSGKIVKEKSRVLIILYPKKSRRENNPKIEQIRAAYVKLFQQESVLRMDFRQPVEVGF